MEDPKIDQLLASHGFENYIELFRLHAVRSDVLHDLTTEDLIDVGVHSLGHRIKILRIIDARRPLNTPPANFGSSKPPLLSNNSTGSFTLPTTSTQTGSQPGQSLSQTSLPSPSSPSSREILALRQRIDNSERHIRKLSEQVARLRADLFRKFKESEPLPTPSVKTMSPQTTPGAMASSAPLLSKRSPSDNYFSRSANFPGSAVPSPSTLRPNSIHVFHGDYQPHSATAPSSASLPGNANLVITAPSEPFKNFRCGEKDNVAKVLSALLQRKYLDGDISQWRLQIEYGEKARELLDHEYPLVVFKQLQDQGHKPVFTMKPTQPHKPPARGSYI